MNNQRAILISSTLLAGSGAAYYLRHHNTIQKSFGQLQSSNFKLPVTQTSLSIKSPVAQKLDFAQIASNSPIEDYYSHNQTPDGNIILAVLDGHAGAECAQVLSKYLAAYVASSIQKCSSSESIISAIKAAFVNLDDDLLKGAFKDSTGNIINPAVAGSCAALAYITPKEVYAAVTGDCRIVLGRKSADGTTHTVELTIDQTIKNAREHERMIEAHPGENVFSRGRVLGGLMPTRAFGDARYKWPLDVAEAVNKAELGSRRRRIPHGYLTPPYVTAEPEVTRYKLSPLETIRKADGSYEQVGDSFLVVACDGIFDELESNEVVNLVDGFNKSPEKRLNDNWIYEETDNAASHLVRNALQNAAKDMKGSVKDLLEIPAPQCRRYRDDMTAYVLLFGKGLTGQELPPIDLTLASVKNDALTAALSRAKL